jgi:hypothetical protein
MRTETLEQRPCDPVARIRALWVGVEDGNTGAREDAETQQMLVRADEAERERPVPDVRAEAEGDGFPAGLVVRHAVGGFFLLLGMTAGWWLVLNAHKFLVGG